VEQLLVQRLVHLFGAHRQEYVAADELVYHLAVGRLTGEYYVALFELHHHVFHFPVDVPRLNGEKQTREKKLFTRGRTVGGNEAYEAGCTAAAQ